MARHHTPAHTRRAQGQHSIDMNDPLGALGELPCATRADKFENSSDPLGWDEGEDVLDALIVPKHLASSRGSLLDDEVSLHHAGGGQGGATAASTVSNAPPPPPPPPRRLVLDEAVNDDDDDDDIAGGTLVNVAGLETPSPSPSNANNDASSPSMPIA